jgi:hypothetical protein
MADRQLGQLPAEDLMRFAEAAALGKSVDSSETSVDCRSIPPAGDGETFEPGGQSLVDGRWSLTITPCLSARN